MRLERITGNGCWKFHADYVALRLISTYWGEATQWLPQGAGADTPPRALAAGDVGMFKGRALADDRAIIHRSPPIAESGGEMADFVIPELSEEEAQSKMDAYEGVPPRPSY